MLPYLILSGYVVIWDKNFSLSKLDETKTVSMTNLFALFNVVFWNLNGFDSASTFAGEV